MKTPSKLALLTAFAAVYVIWGSTYLAILFAIDSIPPLLMAGTRFLTAGALMYAIARRQGTPRSTWVDWRTAVIVGACLLLGGNGGVTLAEQFVASGLAAVIAATVPIYIALLGWLTGTAPRPSPLVATGLAGGFGGVALLVGSSLRMPTYEHPRAVLGIGILLVSAFLWSAGSLYSRRAPNAPSPFVATAQQMLCGGALLLFAAVVTGELRGFHPQRVTAVSLGAWLYLVLVGAIVGYTAYMWLLRHCDPAKVATYAYVNPVVAVLLGAAFAGEKLNARTLVAAALIIGSVALVITAQQVGAAQQRPVPD